MIDQTNETLQHLPDSFYDDNDSAISSSLLNSENRIVTFKPPVYRQQVQRSNSPSPSSDTSEHDITDVSSINEQQQHSFHLQSMKHVLLGLSPLNSGQAFAAHTDQQQLTREGPQMPINKMEKELDHYYQRSHISKYTKDHHRIRLTSSAINRQQQQQRIERENLKILERLQKVRPTRSLRRDELLSNYDRQMSFSSYPMESRCHLPRRPISFSVSEKSHYTSSRASSASRLPNDNISNISYRPVSSSQRLSSARKPIWND